jgi:hypothetical protein
MPARARQPAAPIRIKWMPRAAMGPRCRRLWPVPSSAELTAARENPTAGDQCCQAGPRSLAYRGSSRAVGLRHQSKAPGSGSGTCAGLIQRRAAGRACFGRIPRPTWEMCASRAASRTGASEARHGSALGRSERRTSPWPTLVRTVLSRPLSVFVHSVRQLSAADGQIRPLRHDPPSPPAAPSSTP